MSAQRIARDKLADSHAKITFVEGFADALPNHKELEPASFDRIVCCLMLHHLTRDAKRATLGNAHQLLKPGGELHIADWSKPSSLKMRLANLQIQLIRPGKRIKHVFGDRRNMYIHEVGAKDDD